MALAGGATVPKPSPQPASPVARTVERRNDIAMSPSRPALSVARQHTSATSIPLGAEKENLTPPDRLFLRDAARERLSMSPVKTARPLLESPRKQAMKPFSPRKQAAQSSDLSFTPCRTQLPPRAWERVPAKPFAAAREGQKIWKRVPLQDMGFEANVPGHESRREIEAKQDYLRAVKRMKVDPHGAGPQTVSVEVDGVETGFWATRTEEESIERGGSPKQKARSQRPAQASVVDAEPEGDHPCLEDVPRANDAEIDPEQRQLKPNSGEEEQQQDDLEVGSTSDDLTWAKSPDHTVSERDEPYSEQYQMVEPTPQHAHATNVVPIDSTAERTSDQLSTLESSHPPDEGVTRTEEAMDDGTLPDSQALQQSDGILEQIDQTATHRASEPAEREKSGLSHAQNTWDDQTESPKLDQDPLTGCEDLFDLSAPAGTPNAAHIESGEQAENVMDAEILASMPSPAASKTSTSKSHPVFSGTEQEEDTAFLADFLLRAKASKAAREAATALQPISETASPKKIASPARQVPLESSHIVADKPIDHDASDDQAMDSTLADEVEHTVEAAASSPLRRSTRAANTRLPRPQTLPPVPQFGSILPSQPTALPNTIQLKRATGNEFVFNAKPQRTVLMMTRTNTKRNQGNAVHADVRLKQLKTADPVTASDDPTLEAVSPAKKRKRTKDDDGKPSARSKKNVKWQEELVSYREATPTTSESTIPASDDFAAIEAAAQAEARQSMTDSVGMPSSPSTQPAEGDDLHGQDGDDKVKVRKMRKINVGNVNGTPAPKKRTRSQAQAQAQAHAQAQAETSSTSTTGTSKSRSTGDAKVKLSLPVPTTASLSKPSSITPADAQRKLDGKRRLRDRS